MRFIQNIWREFNNKPTFQGSEPASLIQSQHIKIKRILLIHSFDKFPFIQLSNQKFSLIPIS